MNIEFFIILGIFTTALFLYERYLHISIASAVIARDKMIDIINESSHNEEIRPAAREWAKEVAILAIRKNLIISILKAPLAKRKEEDISINDTEREFLKKIVLETLKVNSIGHIFSYSFLLSAASLILFLIIFN